MVIGYFGIDVNIDVAGLDGMHPDLVSQLRGKVTAEGEHLQCHIQIVEQVCGIRMNEIENKASVGGLLWLLTFAWPSRGSTRWTWRMEEMAVLLVS
jgi:hypothetical protein